MFDETQIKIQIILILRKLDFIVYDEYAMKLKTISQIRIHIFRLHN